MTGGNMKRLIACLVVLTAICGCKTGETFTPEQNATVMMTAEAGVFMAILKEKGGIPEISADRHGSLHSGMMCDPKAEPEFPFNAQFRAVMHDAPGLTYGFVVTKTDWASPWLMTKAWKQLNGVTTDLPLPSVEVQSSANVELQRRKTEKESANKAVLPIAASAAQADR